MRENRLPLIELWSNDAFFALIVQEKTGIEYTNQAGGLSCAHPHTEGYCIPLPESWIEDLKDSLENYCGAYDAELVREWLAERNLEELFEPLDPADCEHFLYEAWIPVRVKELPEHNFWGTLTRAAVGKIGFLTYPNSD